MEASELELAIVSLEHVLLHEEIEYKRVDKLVERLRTDRVLKNPPMVARAENSEGPRYVVLDGASRSSALRKLEIPDILVQIVDYHSPQVKLESWNHLLLDISIADLRRELDDVSCVTMTEMDDAQAQRELDARTILGYLKFTDGTIAGLRCSSDPVEQAHALNEVVRAYESKAELYRVSSTNLEQLVADPKRLAAVMVFPRYKPDEIIQLALGGARVPMGITRHIIPGRALRINLPLEVLENKQPLEEKNAWLDGWVQDKMKQRHVRYYQEPVFLFDEWAEQFFFEEPMDVRDYNREAWNKEVEKGNTWTQPVSPEVIVRARRGDWRVLLTEQIPVPREWIGNIQGKDILGLASGGGQQGPIFAAAGARVTVLDNSPKQLERDREVADREGLTIRTIEGDARDLSMLADESCDLVFHPVSNLFIPQVRPIYLEAFRVLRHGGILLAGFMNPVVYAFPYDALDGKEPLTVKYKLPYSDTEQMPKDELEKLMADGLPLEHSHTLTDQIGGQLDAGFHLTAMYEDYHAKLTLSEFMPTYIATRAIKP